MCKLDAEWEKVQAQTGWKLQCCYMPSKTQPGLSDASSDPKQSPTDENSDPQQSPIDATTNNSESNHPSTLAPNSSEVNSIQQQIVEGEDTSESASQDVSTISNPSFLDPAQDRSLAT